MSREILLVGAKKQALEVLVPLWSELAFTPTRIASASEAIELVRSGSQPDAVVVSLPLGDASIDELVDQLMTASSGHEGKPVLIVVAAAESMSELESLRDRGMTVISEDLAPEELRNAIRGLLSPPQGVSPRLIVRMEVQLGAGRLLRLSQSVNVSASGMLIRTAEDYPLGSVMRMEFVLPDQETPICGQAEVVRHTDAEKEGFKGIGIHFLAFDDDGRERLEEFLR